ncbi:MAG TPA: ribosome-associated translation inhibitor RaiA [Ruminococcaceae bacterium]|nr:ribosome-associated translation inhibitor RaiA [Oscillospiraceae bacterium]
MKTIITGRKVTLNDAFKSRVERKLQKISKFFGDDSEAHVTVTVEKGRETVEITIRNGGMIFRAEDTANDMLDALEKVCDALIRQIRKNKTRLEKRLRSSAFVDAADGGLPLQEPEEEEFKIVRSKRFPIKPLDIDEAILQMNLLGHQFYMFKNVSTGEMNVVYRRKQGDYGLLEPGEE